MAKKLITDQRLEVPIYGLAEAALYLRVPTTTLEYWVFGRERTAGLIKPAGMKPRALSFMNLLECHMLSAMKRKYDLRLPKIRRAIQELDRRLSFAHPLIEAPLFTNRVDVILQELDSIYVNISGKHIGQTVLPDLTVYFERVTRDDKGAYRFYPFIMGFGANEPKSVMMSPQVSFGKPVISNTGISTAVVASRFNARESITDLAGEYGLQTQQIEEAIRWEQSRSAIAG